jgi:hypothetical protein
MPCHGAACQNNVIGILRKILGPQANNLCSTAASVAESALMSDGRRYASKMVLI